MALILIGVKNGQLTPLIGEMPVGIRKSDAHITVVVRHGNQMTFLANKKKAHQICCDPKKLGGEFTSAYAISDSDSPSFDVDWRDTNWSGVGEELKDAMQLNLQDRDIIVLVTPPIGTMMELI